jgi:uncharacterized protein YndB with AHSA1/START domain
MAEETTASATKHDLVITRVFDAPVRLVWKAWTDPAYVMRWWGPDYFTAPMARIDFRVGGVSLLCMRAPAEFGGQDFYSTWEYTEIVPMERIAFIHNLSNEHGEKVEPTSIGMPPDFPVDQLQVITFKALDDDRTELTVTEYGWTPGQMMKMSRTGMEQCLEKMAVAIAEESGND